MNRMAPGAAPRIEVLVTKGCPHTDATLERVQAIAARLAPHASVSRIVVETPERAATTGFLGSPTVRVNGRDIEGSDGVSALACRVYDGSGIPPEWMIEAAIARAFRPSGVLFLCVANSARSQMAEGIARASAGPGIRIWSAGSQPTKVRPEAIDALREIGIDISGHRSKDVSEIPANEIDLVVTLCAEEVCPVFLGQALRLHWALPDPAAAAGSEEDRREAFRRVRDELRRRILPLVSFA